MFSFWKTFFILKMLDLKEICKGLGWNYSSFPGVETVSVSSAIVEANFWFDHHDGFLEYSVVDSEGEIKHSRFYGTDSFLNRKLRMLLISEITGYLEEGRTNKDNVFERNNRLARFKLG